MSKSLVSGSTITAATEENEALAKLRALLQKPQGDTARLVVAGEQADVPPEALQLLARCVEALSEHQSVAVVATAQRLTTQEAADVLNVSRPYLVRLLQQGAIPYTRTGTHRRVRVSDILTYKARRDADRRERMRELSRLGQELDTEGTQAAQRAREAG